MRKVFKHCYEMDQRCYEEYGLTEDILMEHAAKGIKNYIDDNLKGKNSILIVAGVGNNGADGITLARLLQFNIQSVKLYIPFGVKSPMAQKQLERTRKLEYVEIVDSLCEADIIVDALFGAGLSRSLDENIQTLIDSMNDLNGFKIACDIPSGIDEAGCVSSVAFCADITVTMGARKESLYMDVVKDLVGEIIRVDLGIRYNQYTKGMPVSSYLLDREDMGLPSRDFAKDTHKGSFGHVAVFCGEKEGAGIIAGMSAAKFGVGLVSLVAHEKISPPPYLMCTSEIPGNATALAIGMGLGGYFDKEFLRKNVIESHLPIVLDADACRHRELLEVLEQKEREIVLTPHPKEFAYMWQILTGEQIDTTAVQEGRFELLRRFGTLYPHATLLLKGANTLITQEQKIYINPFGSSRLSKGGSGDVLSGLVASLLAQGHISIDAAIQGSLALTTAAENYSGSSYAMLPTDLIDEIGRLEK